LRYHLKSSEHSPVLISFIDPYVPSIIIAMFRSPLVIAVLVGMLGLALPVRTYALLPGQPYYDYYNRAAQPPQLLDSVKIHHLEPAEATLRGKDPNRLQSAAGDLRYVLDYFPNHPRALSMMTDVALQWKKPQLIEKFLDEALETFPNTPSTWTIQGIYLARIGKIEGAIASYQQALKLQPDDMQTHYAIGLAYASKGRWDLANQHAQAAYRLGAVLPGLKQKLIKAGEWKPEPVSSGASTTPEASKTGKPSVPSEAASPQGKNP
jgi:tetratricopeptide (TPR) repeat protein